MNCNDFSAEYAEFEVDTKTWIASLVEWYHIFETQGDQLMDYAYNIARTHPSEAIEYFFRAADCYDNMITLRCRVRELSIVRDSAHDLAIQVGISKLNVAIRYGFTIQGDLHVRYAYSPVSLNNETALFHMQIAIDSYTQVVNSIPGDAHVLHRAHWNYRDINSTIAELKLDSAIRALHGEWMAMYRNFWDLAFLVRT